MIAGPMDRSLDVDAGMESARSDVDIDCKVRSIGALRYNIGASFRLHN